LTGVEGVLDGIPPGDTVSRLRLARPFFQLDSRTVGAPLPIWEAHCPMCQRILAGHPTFGVACPHCSQGISYVQWTADYRPEPTDAALAGRSSFIWLPRKVGEFLKKRYTEIWR
jgi:hypothetical protein